MPAVADDFFDPEGDLFFEFFDINGEIFNRKKSTIKFYYGQTIQNTDIVDAL